jgi:hypothetical protein
MIMQIGWARSFAKVENCQFDFKKPGNILASIYLKFSVLGFRFCRNGI